MQSLILFVVILFSNLTLAPLEPIYSSLNTVFNLVWSADSVNLYFQDDGYGTEVDVTGPGWMTYNVALSKLTKSNRFPLQPDFPQELKEKMGLIHQYPHRPIESIFVLSPSGLFGVYTATKPASWA